MYRVLNYMYVMYMAAFIFNGICCKEMYVCVFVSNIK